MDNSIVDGVNEIEIESIAETETGIESKNCSCSRETEDENELEEGEIVYSDVSVNDDSEDDSEDITNWAIHDDESRRRSDRSRNDFEIREYHMKHPVARVVDANDDFEALLKEEPQIEYVNSKLESPSSTLHTLIDVLKQISSQSKLL
ncbi:hypothetical protein P8452_25698 [Trifolium repens]|nr:hypothetical protein P8452_25698 [Trifolium repens]